MLPGLPNQAAIFRTHRYTVNAEDVDLYTDMGAPTGAVLVLVRVDSGIYLSSSDRSVPAFNVSNLAAGSHVILLNEGEIRGAGGDGGRGASIASTLNYGGGGGGAGVVPGLGAPGGRLFDEDGDPVDGEPGTEFLGGANGAFALYSQFPPGSAESGEDGGSAILAGSIRITVYNTGTIWGGGGGASGYTDAGPPFDVFGGDPGQDGGSHTGTPPGGAGGYAINGTDVTVVTGGTTPDLEGPIG